MWPFLVGGGMLANYVMQQINSKKQFKYMDKAMNREDSSVRRRVEDLKAAGMSPVLAAGQGASTMSPIKPDIPQLKMDDLQNVLIGAQKDKMKSDMEVNDMSVRDMQSGIRERNRRIDLMNTQMLNLDQVRENEILRGHGLNLDNMNKALKNKNQELINAHQEMENARYDHDNEFLFQLKTSSVHKPNFLADVLLRLKHWAGIDYTEQELTEAAGQSSSPETLGQFLMRVMRNRSEAGRLRRRDRIFQARLETVRRENPDATLEELFRILNAPLPAASSAEPGPQLTE